MNYKNTILTGFLAASALFLGVAQAQVQAPTAGSGPVAQRGTVGCIGVGPAGGRPMRGGMPGLMDPVQRLDRLKSELKINTQQEPLWQAFADQSKSSMGKGPMGVRDKLADGNLSAPDRLAQMQTLAKEHLVAMEARNESFKRLYTALSPEQQAAADKHFSRIGQNMRSERMGSRGRGGPAGPGVPGGTSSPKS